MSKDISFNLLDSEANLNDVLTALNRGVFGVVFIADKQWKIQGLFTDGDVRRALLAGADLKSSATNFMKKEFLFGKSTNRREENIRLLSDNVRHLPILDENGRLVDFLSWAEMWRLPVMEPTLGGNELKYVSDCIASNWISSQGSYVQAFEQEFAKFSDNEFALTTTSGTTALHLALVALGIGPGDEVIVPDLTFGATANVVVHAGATPIFIDVDQNHWTLNPALLEKAVTAKTKAIMPVHLYGHPCDMDPIMDFAREHRLFVVEDCAEALGAKYKGQLVGTFGDVGCFSFFSNKVITTGEGGMITTSDHQLYERMMLLRDHGMKKSKRYWHELAGFNYRMTNLQAAVGLAQLEQIDKFLSARRNVADQYTKCLSGVDGITLPPEMNWAHNIYWLYSILTDEAITGITRDEFIRLLGARGVETRPFFYPLHNQPPFPRSDVQFPVSDRLSAKGISLPSSITLNSDEIDRVCSCIKELIDQHSMMNNLRAIQIS
jgi:perosamine synthetase